MSRSTGRWLLAGVLVATALLVVMAALSGGAHPTVTRPTESATAGSALASHSPTLGESGAATSTASIGPRRIWLVVLENRSYRQVLGRADAPYLNRLAAQYGLATDFHGVARPSQPNYLALISGSTQGVRDDGSHNLRAPSLLDQLEAAGRDWRVYAENVPNGCFTGARASGGQDGAGTYARKHEPAISFVSISSDPQRCARITGLSGFDPAAADFSLIIPNLCHDMHDCSTRDGDRWLASFLPRIIGSAAFRDGGLLLVTFDEAAGDDGSQHIPLIFAGPGVAARTYASEGATHYSLLRTIQEAFGLPCLALSCRATSIPELLGR